MTEHHRSLTITWDDPHAAFAASKGLSGIEYMHAMIAGAIVAPPIMKLLDSAMGCAICPFLLSV